MAARSLNAGVRSLGRLNTTVSAWPSWARASASLGQATAAPATSVSASAHTHTHARTAATHTAHGASAGSGTYYYSGALDAGLERGSAGARPKPADLPYVDTLRAAHLLRMRMHVGHHKRKLNRGNAGLIYGFRHNVAVYDLAKTWKSLRTVFHAFAEMAAVRSSFFLLAPNPRLPLRPLIQRMAREYPFRYNKFNSLYMTGYSDVKWVDGIFSNWKTTHSYFEHMRRMADETGGKRFRRYVKYLRGISSTDMMGKIVPDFVLVFATDRGALHEAANLDLPLVGMVDTNTNPMPFLFPVFGNDDSVESLAFMMELIKRGVEEGRKREHEAFAIMLLRKIKAKLDPAYASTAAEVSTPDIPDVEANADVAGESSIASVLGTGKARRDLERYVAADAETMMGQILSERRQPPGPLPVV